MKIIFDERTNCHTMDGRPVKFVKAANNLVVLRRVDALNVLIVAKSEFDYRTRQPVLIAEFEITAKNGRQIDSLLISSVS